jgi:hypothetical protein
MSTIVDGNSGGTALTTASRPITRGYLFGLEGSTAGASTTLTVSAGQATDSTYVSIMTLASAMAKTTGAWAAGTTNGGLDTGTIANNTWYHWYLISDAAGSTVDVVFSTSATSPTLPGGYTLYRRIFSWRATFHWDTVLQVGDYFYRAEVNDFQPATTSVMTLRTISVPSGVTVWPKMRTLSVGGSANGTVLQVAPAGNSALYITVAHNDIGSGINSNTQASAFEGPATNTSAQIYMAVPHLQASGSLQVYTAGWVDGRGRNS